MNITHESPLNFTNKDDFNFFWCEVALKNQSCRFFLDDFSPNNQAHQPALVHSKKTPVSVIDGMGTGLCAILIILGIVARRRSSRSIAVRALNGIDLSPFTADVMMKRMGHFRVHLTRAGHSCRLLDWNGFNLENWQELSIPDLEYVCNNLGLSFKKNSSKPTLLITILEPYETYLERLSLWDLGRVFIYVIGEEPPEVERRFLIREIIERGF